MSVEAIFSVLPVVAVLAVAAGLIYSGYVVVSCFMASLQKKSCPFA